VSENRLVGQIIQEVGAGDSRQYHQGYLLEAALAQGGQATAYVAKDLTDPSSLDEKVIVKLFKPFEPYIPRDSAIDPITGKSVPVPINKWEAFETEGHRTSKWQHPNILHTHTYGIGRVLLEGYDVEHPMIVMPYMPEGSLRARMKRLGRLPLSEIVDFTYQASQGIEYVHRRGMIHRDIKPDNLLLERVKDALVLKVADFGIAAKLHEAGAQNITTQPNLGSFMYSPPEQMQGKSVRQSDIYSLAAVAYELITHTPAAAGATGDFTQEYLRIPVQDFDKVPGLDVTLALSTIEPIIMDGLARNPQDRPKNIASFGQSIKDAYDAAISIEKRKTQVIDLSTVPTQRLINDLRAIGSYRIGPAKTARLQPGDAEWITILDGAAESLSQFAHANEELHEQLQEAQNLITILTEHRNTAVQNVRNRDFALSQAQGRIERLEQRLREMQANHTEIVAGLQDGRRTPRTAAGHKPETTHTWNRRRFIKATGALLSVTAIAVTAPQVSPLLHSSLPEQLPEAQPAVPMTAEKEAVLVIANELVTNIKSAKKYGSATAIARSIAAYDTRIAEDIAAWLYDEKHYDDAVVAMAAIAPYNPSFVAVAGNHLALRRKEYDDILAASLDPSQGTPDIINKAITDRNFGLARASYRMQEPSGGNDIYYLTSLLEKIGRTTPQENEWISDIVETYVNIDAQYVEQYIYGLKDAGDIKNAAQLAIRVAAQNPDITKRVFDVYSHEPALRNTSYRYLLAMSLAGHMPTVTQSALARANPIYQSWMKLALKPSDKELLFQARQTIKLSSDMAQDSFWFCAALIAAHAKKQ